MGRFDKTGVLQELTTDLTTQYEYSEVEETPKFNKEVKEDSVPVKFLKYVLVVLVIAIAFLAVFRLTLSPTKVDGNSMTPTLQDGQVWFSESTLLKKPTTGDIVRAYSRSDRTVVVKRVVAVEGDVVSVTDEGILVNGELVDNSNETLSILNDTTTWLGSHKGDEVKVYDSNYFLLGDNRDNSRDSRYYGLVSKADIQTVLTSKAPDWFASMIK